MIIALTGSRCSSCCSTRNSLDRCRTRAADSLLPAAADVVRPHAVLRLRPALTESESVSARDRLAWTLCQSLVLRPADQLSLPDRDMLTESERPVLVV